MQIIPLMRTGSRLDPTLCKNMTQIPYEVLELYVFPAISKRPLAISKRPNYLPGRFETFLGFEMAWPVQNLVSKWPNQ